MSVPLRELASCEPLGALARLALCAEVLVTYGRVRRLLRQADFRRTLAAVGERREPPAGVGEAEMRAASRRLARAVVRTLALLPADSRCLVRSLVLTALLARRGIESRLIVGVRPGTRFAAHAWVEHDGMPLLEAGQFERLLEH